MRNSRVRFFTTTDPAPRPPQPQQQGGGGWRFLLSSAVVLGLGGGIYVKTYYPEHSLEQLKDEFLGTQEKEKKVVEQFVQSKVEPKYQHELVEEEESNLSQFEEPDSIEGGKEEEEQQFEEEPKGKEEEEEEQKEVEVEGIVEEQPELIEVDIEELIERGRLFPPIEKEEIEMQQGNPVSFELVRSFPVVEEKDSKKDDRFGTVVELLQAKIVVLESELEEKNGQIFELEAKVTAAEEQKELEITVVKQDIAKEYARHLESRVELERLAMEERKDREIAKAVDVQVQMVSEQADKEVEIFEANFRKEAEKRMRILRGLFEEIEKGETALKNISKQMDEMKKTFRMNVIADDVRKGLSGANGKAGAKDLKRLKVSCVFLVNYRLTKLFLRKAFEMDKDSVVFNSIDVIPLKIFDTGAMTNGALLENFDKLAQEGLERALVPEEQGTFLYLFGKVISKTLIKPSEKAKSGDTADAIFSRARVAIQKQNLSTAVRELGKLDPEIGKIFDKWVVDAKERIYVDNALNTIRAQATTFQ